MGNKSVLQGHLFSWKEYLDHIKFKESLDWLTVLKVGLEIYSGESKGFAKQIPSTSKQPRQVVAQKTSDPNMGLNSASGQSDAYQADSIAIKVAIEFCLNINAIQYLFTDIYQIFVENRLEMKFILNLEPFILSGQFRKESLPEHIIKKMIQYYENKESFKTLEKLIMNLDFKDYTRKEELILTCQSYCMVSAFLYLMTSHSEDVFQSF